MLERRRKNKHYDLVPGEEEGLMEGEGDVELGEGVGPGAKGPEHGLGEQETGTMPAEANGDVHAEAGAAKMDVSEELDNWDENAEDWEENEVDNGHVEAEAREEEDVVDTKKRTD